MIAWVFLFLLGCGDGGASPPPTTAHETEEPESEPVLLTWHLSGTLADGGTFDGAFTYGSKTAPGPRQTPPTIDEVTQGTFSAVTDWQIRLTATPFHPALVFRKAGLGETAEVCEGTCVVLTPSLHQLIFDTGNGPRLEVSFLLPDGMGLPQDVSQWGSVYLPRSWLRSKFIHGKVNEFVQILTVQIETLSTTP